MACARTGLSALPLFSADRLPREPRSGLRRCFSSTCRLLFLRSLDLPQICNLLCSQTLIGRVCPTPLLRSAPSFTIPDLHTDLPSLHPGCCPLFCLALGFFSAYATRQTHLPSISDLPVPLRYLNSRLLCRPWCYQIRETLWICTPLKKSHLSAAGFRALFLQPVSCSPICSRRSLLRLLLLLFSVH